MIGYLLSAMLNAAAADGHAAQLPSPTAPQAAPPAGSAEHHWGAGGGGGRFALFITPMGEPIRGQPSRQAALAAWFAEADLNHDGVLSLQELEGDAARFFQVLDTNHDGEIDPDEIARYEDEIAPAFRVRSNFSAEDLPGGGQQVHFDDESGAGRFGLLQIPEPVVSADSNFDGSVSATEFASAAASRFGLLDVNHTGRLTLPELENIRHAAAALARRRGQSKPSVGPSDDPASAEYGQPPPY